MTATDGSSARSATVTGGCTGLLGCSSTPPTPMALCASFCSTAPSGATTANLGSAGWRQGIADESVEEAALREAVEETALDGTKVRLRHTFVDDHGGWSYTTVYADSMTQLETVPNKEVSRTRVGACRPSAGTTPASWIRSYLARRPLAASDPGRRRSQRGRATPNGWWNDRAGAAARLGASLARLIASTLPDEDISGVVSSLSVVVEGQARDVTLPDTVATVRATGSGDDALVTTVEDLARVPQRLVVVTSDRELRSRVTHAAGDQVIVRGARWLLDLLPKS